MAHSVTRVKFDRHYDCNMRLVEHIDLSAWEKQPCAIIGGGHSLSNVSNLDIPQEFKRIGINRAFEKYRCDILYTMDARFLRWVDSGVMDAHTKKSFKRSLFSCGAKVALLSPDDAIRRIDLSKTYLIKRKTEPCVSTNLSDGIWGGNNSGMGGLMLAVALRCNPIYLYGFDFNIDRATHWHNGYPEQKADELIEKHKGFVRMIEQVSEEIKSLGYQVYNCNVHSALRCFDFMEHRRQ